MTSTQRSRQHSFTGSSLTSRPLVIKEGSTELSILISSDIWGAAEQLREEFQLANQLESITSEELSQITLTSLFLRFTVDRAENEDIQSFYPVVRTVFFHLREYYLKNNDVHAATTNLSLDHRYIVIHAYFHALCVLRKEGILYADDCPAPSSALLTASRKKEACLFAVFGGQGNSEEYFDELVELFNNYEGFVRPFITKMSSVLRSLALSPDASAIHSKGLNVLKWLENPETRPDVPYLISAPVSLPMIGLIQLTHYLVTMKVLGMSPDQLRNHFNGSTGHSQGIISAAVIASSSNEESFYENTEKALGLLFWIGARSQQIYPQVTLNPTILQDSLNNDEGNPSVMLAIFNLRLSEVQKHVDATNLHLPQERQISIDLVNGPRSVVCTGHPQSLNGLNVALRKFKAPAGLEQSKIPYSQRKLKFSSRFLPITAPFHGINLAKAPEIIIQDAKKHGLLFRSQDLTIPVLATDNGTDLRDSQDLTLELINLICTRPVNWEVATDVKELTHVIDFGPGGVSGIGGLTYRNKEGTGVQVILAGTLQGSNSNLSYKSDIFNADPNSVKYSVDWAKAFQPKLLKIKSTGRIVVDTRMSRLIGKPPLMVPGMTPCTVPAKFVAAVINAGYHVELAGGGHFSEPMFRQKVDDIMKLVQPGEGITVNMLFINAFQWGFQFPLVQTMRKEGYPIEGICIAAGVPSPDVANDIVSQLLAVGIKHISFKPGSVSTIRQVVSIAANNPTMSVILQWTGGRAGGHHSFEDFHQPILETYASIRQQPNIVLVAGSGFGGSEDTFPYLTGDWSKAFDYPPMPYDGILFGSRMMVAAESEAAYDVKQAMVDAPGVDDKDWENTYTKETGGILTVKSELGEPIHKVATRGIKFWKEMDDTLFSLPKNKRQAVLDSKKEYIIKKLNQDFQKVWFGKKANGETADLQDMTYAEVVNRLVELTYVKHENRWVDISLRRFLGDFMCRLEERFIAQETASLLQDYKQIHEPFELVAKFLEAYPQASKQLLTSEDIQYFLTQCLRRDQKPVPFIPILDANLEFWFKKDSLWQSEDLQAVPGQDVQRTAILHGPIAAKHSNKINVPAKEILDTIHDAHVVSLTERYYNSDSSSIPSVEYIGGDQVNYPNNLPKDVIVIKDNLDQNLVIYETHNPGSLDLEQWLQLISGPKESWLKALLTSPIIIQDGQYLPNPLKRVFKPRESQKISIRHDGDKIVELKVHEIKHDKNRVAIKVNLSTNNQIDVTFYEQKGDREIPLVFPYLYKPDQGYASIHEIMEDRNLRIKEFYFKLWFSEEDINQIPNDPSHQFVALSENVSKDEIIRFCQTVGNQAELYADLGKETINAPVDFAIVVGWKAIIKTIFPKFINGDLLKLVHLSNGFRMFENVAPLQSGDVVDTCAKITAVINNSAGKMVQVKGLVKRDNIDVMEVTSQFLYRGKFEDFEHTFQHVEELPMEIVLNTTKDIAVLKSKPWFVWECKELQLEPGSILTFRLNTYAKFQSASVYSQLDTSGVVTMQVKTKEVIPVASVNYINGTSHGNPVIEYLKRLGKPIDQATMFENGGYSVMPKGEGFNAVVQTPASNFSYAQISQDLNPIHVNPYFADLAGLPGTITHGMWTSASTRKFIETFAADNYPLRVTSYQVSFLDMVLPGDQLTTNLYHIGMKEGKKIIKVEVINQNGAKVLEGTAEVDQPSTAYVFTGQGSQEVGMGMSLYESSPVARAIWDNADAHYLKYYGFSILDIVKNNPKEHTVHFGGAKGKVILNNYTSMTYEKVNPEDNTTQTLPLFPQVNENSTSFTFTSPDGLLSATQFTQPALTLMEKASFEDMRVKGLVQKSCPFAGHSLGEYAALSALGNVLPIDILADLVFYRGMSMQNAVQRDANGRTDYGMMAVNPSRISKTLNETYLKYIIESISHQSGGLIQIVNYNVENWQYVLSGETTNLDTLTNVLNYMKASNIDIHSLLKTMDLEQVKEHLSVIINEALSKSQAKKAKHGFIKLERGFATIPLQGLDVPFHSSFLLSGVAPFRSYILQKLRPNLIDVGMLIGKYIPNLTAIPFQITKEYFETVYKLTNSARASKVVKNWPENNTFTPAQQQQIGFTLLVELLSFQFASPVRWIETQDQLFKNFGVERLIEVGPSPTLANMADRTLKLKYAEYDDARNFQRVNLCASKHEKEIYYNIEPEETTTTSDAGQSSQKEAAALVPVAAAPVAVAAALVARGPVKSIEDQPVQAIDVLHTVVAQKLKKELTSIPLTSAIKDLVGGKSTLQNEILGDLQKEFGNNIPEKPEETPLEELAAALQPAFSGTLGKHTAGLLSKLIAAKMPGGFTLSNARDHLSGTYGLGVGRTDSVLLLGLTKEPASRLNSEGEAKSWLDSIAQAYASKSGITLSSSSGAEVSSGGSGGAVIDSAEFNALTKKQNALYKLQIQLLAKYLGEDQYATQKLYNSEKLRADQLQQELDIFVSEHGEFYVKGVKPIFDARKVRNYDSYWNWSRQDALTLYYDFLFGRITAVDRDVTSQAIHLMNRSDPTLVDFMKYHIGNCPAERNSLYKNTKEFGYLLIENVEQFLERNPVYKDVAYPVAPSTTVTESGDVIYKEVLRPGIRKLADYVKEMEKGSDLTKLNNRQGIQKDLAKILKIVQHQPRINKGYKDEITSLYNDVVRSLALSKENYRGSSKPTNRSKRHIKPKLKPGSNKQHTSTTDTKENLPFLHLKKKDEIHGWEYNTKLTLTYLEALAEIASSGQTFQNKNVLITGCGKHSIGAEILCGLLSGGAKVIVTTSRFSREATEYYQKIYQRYGSKGSSLIVLPFNQGSKQDVDNLVEYIYNVDEKKGLNVDLDFIIPFGALPENGREITDLDGLSEFAHRVMLTNLLRLLGCVKSMKEKLGYHTRPAQVIVPLSPNHGLFGGDGLYSESKLGLENLMNRWKSESWGSYLTIVGTVIGWTRGTGLMNQNNIVSEGVEERGVRTFSTQEMAFNILGLMHPKLVNLAQDSPVWADLNGGFQYLPNFKDVVTNLRKDIMETSTIRRAIATDNSIDLTVVNGPTYTSSFKPKTSVPRANIQFNFPQLKQYGELQQLNYLQGMLDLEKVIVVTGFGEVGPWGNARTRWEMEAHGEFSLEGCIELAWLMGLIVHHNGPMKSGQQYTGWVDSKTKEPVPDHQVKAKYESIILEHAGIRLIEPELFHGYDPNNRFMMREVMIDHDLEPIEVSAEEAQNLKQQHKDKVEIFEIKETGSWIAHLRKGASIYVPKSLRGDRLVAGQVPTGWDALRYGVPEDIINQVDRITLFVLVSFVEALVASGITDPYEFYKYVHVSEVGNTAGSGMGGMESLRKMYKDRLMDIPVQNDILQETFINTMPAWINLLLLSSSGPIKTPVGACATAVESVEIGVDTILNGKARIVIVGGYDDFHEEGSAEFANMKATSNSLDEFAMGRTPQEMSRPTTTTRSGFMESQGSGIQILMSAKLAIEMGVPIYGIVALTNTATDKEGRSVPAPGQGILTSAKEVKHNFKSPLLNLEYRRRQMDYSRQQIKSWVEREYQNLQLEVEQLKLEGALNPESESDFIKERTSYISKESLRQEKSALNLWGNEFYKKDSTIAPLRGALAVYGLTIDDVGVASFHGTSTKANDKNESQVVDSQFQHLGRSKGNACPGIFQKYLTGHPKGAAAAWMLNGVLQVLQTGIIPGNRNADNIDINLKQFKHILYPSRSIHTDGVKAGLLKSFGFGQVGGEVLIIHPDYLFGALTKSQYTDYVKLNQVRQAKAYRYFHDSITNVATLIQVKHEAPYTDALESKVYLNPNARAEYDTTKKSYRFKDAADKVVPKTTDPLLTQDILAKLQSQGSEAGNRGVGVDVELVSAINVDNQTFIERNFTPQEIIYCNSRPDPNASFAGKWAAKEAVVKAVSSLQQDSEPVWTQGAAAPLIDIEIVPSTSQAPSVVFHNQAKLVAEKNNVQQVKISISHSGQYAIAMAIAE